VVRLAGSGDEYRIRVGQWRACFVRDRDDHRLIILRARGERIILGISEEEFAKLGQELHKEGLTEQEIERLLGANDKRWPTTGLSHRELPDKEADRWRNNIGSITVLPNC
jgi:hypothetical protein